MKTIEMLKKEKQKKYSDLIEEVGMFFAFSESQFNEGKTPLKKGEKYVSIGNGGYIPKGNVNEWIKGVKKIEKWFRAEIKASKNENKEILYELINHECFYTGDYTDAYSALPGYTKKQIQEVFYNNRLNYQ